MSVTRKISSIAILSTAMLCALQSQASESTAESLTSTQVQLRLTPQVYGGPRGAEPLTQATAQVKAAWESAKESKTPWRIDAHFDVETLGRRDLSLDLDEAWVRTNEFTLGRIHPWTLSTNPDARRPWGLGAQSQSQNRGVNLGSPFGSTVFPEPRVMGWFGAHYWNSANPIRFGFSLTPLFLPNLGSEVVFSDQQQVSAGRFARRPPGYVRAGEATLPLRYRIDSSDLLREVLLQPQLLAQAAWGSSSPGWLSLAYHPSPDPSSKVDGYLAVSSDVVAVAEVKPKFPYQISATLTQQWEALFVTAAWRRVPTESISHAGFELGIRSENAEVSLLQEERFGSLSSSPEAGIPYSQWLAQAFGRVQLPKQYLVGVGIKHHLTQGGTWLRTLLGRPLSPTAKIELGLDVFGGSDQSYFGEWRTNDRVFVALQWNLGGRP